MKMFLSLTFALLFAGTAGIALAQADSSAPAESAAPATQSTPMAPKMKGAHPLIHEIQTRLQDQNKRIMEGIQKRTLTKDEMVALHAKIKSIREEMQGDLKTNGKKELTEDQFKQLNQELDDNSKAIHDEKSQGASDAGTLAASTTPTAN